MRKKKYVCYDEWWLHSDMDNMGYIFEYCVKYCKQLFGATIDRRKFLEAFMRSECRAAMEQGDPRLLSQAGQDTVKAFVKYDCNGDLSVFATRRKDNNYEMNQWYWVGWMYAYIHFRTTVPSRQIIKKLPLQVMLDDYYMGHEMSKETYFSKVQNLF